MYCVYVRACVRACVRVCVRACVCVCVCVFVCTVPSQKRAHGQCTLHWVKIRGWADIRGISIAFIHETGKLPTLSS